MLTAKQKLFIQNYALNCNQAAAARSAGYSPDNASHVGSKILRKEEAKNYLQSILEERSREFDHIRNGIINELVSIAFADPASLYDETGNLLPINEIPLDVRKSINEIRETTITNEDGVTKTFRRAKLSDRLRALEILGKICGSYEIDHNQRSNRKIVFEDASPVIKIIKASERFQQNEANEDD